jgi:DNA-binding GntR family transcriptional regulator
MGTAHMVTIGLGRNDPRRWVQTAYTVLDTMESEETDPHDPVPSKAELTRKLNISAHTAGRALRELADMGIIYHVPGHGYFPNTAGEE